MMLAVILTACDMNAVRGSGKVITENRNVSGFSEVEVNGTGRLIVEQDGNEALTIETDDNLMPYLKSEVRDGKLRIGTEGLANLRPSSNIIYRLSAKHLGGISVSGSMEVDARKIHTDEFAISVSGAGEISVDGAATKQTVTISGAADYRAADFKTREATISISGAGNAVVAVEEKLDVQISGAGEIEYVGDPAITKSVSGAGSIRKRSS
jgi:hypothetical protein